MAHVPSASCRLQLVDAHSRPCLAGHQQWGRGHRQGACNKHKVAEPSEVGGPCLGEAQAVGEPLAERGADGQEHEVDGREQDLRQQGSTQGEASDCACSEDLSCARAQAIQA